MEYRKLGRTGLKASVIGFGAEWIGKMEQAEVNAMAARGAAGPFPPAVWGAFSALSRPPASAGSIILFREASGTDASLGTDICAPRISVSVSAAMAASVLSLT